MTEGGFGRFDSSCVALKWQEAAFLLFPRMAQRLFPGLVGVRPLDCGSLDEGIVVYFHAPLRTSLTIRRLPRASPSVFFRSGEKVYKQLEHAFYLGRAPVRDLHKYNQFHRISRQGSHAKDLQAIGSLLGRCQPESCDVSLC